MVTDPQIAKRIKADLGRALMDAAGLPAKNVEFVLSLITAGEWELALEILCTQIYEEDLDLIQGQRALLLKLGAELKVPVASLLGDPWAPQAIE